jgi:1,6-anhydro-N-acetylmuramate kinase
VDVRRIVGCMTGTSLDAVDAALVEVTGRGLAMSARVLAGHTVPLGSLARRLRAVAEQVPTDAGTMARLGRDLALLHARAVRELLSIAPPSPPSPPRAGGRAAIGDSSDAPAPSARRAPHASPAPIDLVCVHGQTVYHAPPLSWQLINAPVIAHELHVPVVFDLRAADLAAGGQGAPITPLADWVLFRGPSPVAVVNLGGFCNVTLLPGGGGGPDAVEGFDVCACNLVLDAVARAVLGRPYDDGGRDALAGRVSPQALADLADLLGAQARAGRSLGTGDEVSAWIERYRARVDGRDLAASACHAIARCIVSRTGQASRLLLSGGGAQNRALVGAIAGLADAAVQTLDAAGAGGVAPAYREAACFAVLGALCQDRVPVTLPRVTRLPGPAPVAGCWAGV